MFKIKTPHRRPLRHLLNMYGLFVVAALATTLLHAGATITGGASLVSVACSALTAGAIGLLAGIVVTAVTRRVLRLTQTGRVIQYTGFWLASWLGLKAAAYFFSAITLSAPAFAGFVLFALAFGAATALGEVPTRGRTWLPVADKKARAKDSAKDPAKQPAPKSPNKDDMG